MKVKLKSTVDTKTKLENLCAWLAEKKARNLVAFELGGHNNLAEGVIVAGATSLRHGQGLADFALEMAKENNYEFLHMEGYQNGLWILLDFNDVLLNIFQPEQRELYRLEDLYPNATILRDDRE
ncbi:ribosome silencing factor [Desulfovibrio sp. OttesenSCG-928-C06]|nr:ribosome silencing factor [Desulfovibrio sp. OttesenSCG-928-C06]